MTTGAFETFYNSSNLLDRITGSSGFPGPVNMKQRFIPFRSSRPLCGPAAGLFFEENYNLISMGMKV
jgi:hypothetical protein